MAAKQGKQIYTLHQFTVQYPNRASIVHSIKNKNLFAKKILPILPYPNFRRYIHKGKMGKINPPKLHNLYSF